MCDHESTTRAGAAHYAYGDDGPTPGFEFRSRRASAITVNAAAPLAGRLRDLNSEGPDAGLLHDDPTVAPPTES